jgi:hypothetical protein
MELTFVVQKKYDDVEVTEIGFKVDEFWTFRIPENPTTRDVELEVDYAVEEIRKQLIEKILEVL